ncbi:retrovirus-related Pol polyprotein from transposon TNT 1-94 [Trichonephila clavipes]|nr:retrovirus-related Pol polyprotein from transposon TNT 1-94 [Trichonephila clavipes]
MHYGAWEFIGKKERSPEEEAKLSWRDRSDLKLRKDRAFTLIYQSVSNEFKPLISSTTDVPDTFLAKIFICRVKRSAELLREVGHDLPALYQGYQMIRSLPDDFRSTVQAIYRWSDKDFVPDKIEAELLLEENRLGVVKKDLEDVSTFAFSDEVKHDYSRKVTVFPLKNKSDVFQTFVKFQRRAERFLNKKVISVRTNRGLEFCSGEFRVFLEDLGIDHEKTYSPEMNGVAERYSLTALDGIKTLSNENGISQKFWAEALICFSYTWNRICHKGCKKTPFELHGGKRPSVSHLKRFGCLAFVVVPKQLRRKLDIRAKLGIMLGYTLSTKGYRIWLIEENKDFPEDDDIFSTVGDRADHQEAGSEKDTRPGGADSENQTGGTHTLRPCASIPWIRKPVERKDRSLTDIYYFVEGSNVRLSGKNSSSGKVTDLLNLPLEEKANLAEVRIPKTYREATRTAEAADWEGAMDKEMQVMYDRKVWNLVEPPKEAKVLGYVNNAYLYARLDKVIYMQQPEGYVNEANKMTVMFGETKKNLDNGITLLQGHFDLKKLGKTKKLLGIEFEEKNEKLYIHQSSYIEKLCKQYERFKFPVSSLPIPKGLVLSKLDCPSTPAEINEMAKYPYRNLIGSLSFIAARTRPDIMYAVNLLSQFQSNPGIKHWNNSHYAANRDDRVSIGGYILLVDETPISWRTFKQKCILSTMEAEFVTLTEAAKELIWLKDVLENELLKLELKDCLLLYDNQAAISFSKS